MNIVILNATPMNGSQKMDLYLKRLEEMAHEKGLSVETLFLRELEILDCIGCYGCWLKTPGLCARQDDMKVVLEKIVNSDVVLFGSSLVMGFISSSMKSVQDRLLPLVHPFLKIEKQKMTHYPRYEKLPSMFLVVEEPLEDDTRSLEIIREIYESSGKNFKKVYTTQTEEMEVLNEITRD